MNGSSASATIACAQNARSLAVSPTSNPNRDFEPLSIAVDDRHQDNRCIEDGRCQRGQPVIAIFCLCVENAQASHCFQSMLFIRMRFGWLHIDSSTALMKT